MSSTLSPQAFVVIPIQPLPIQSRVSHFRTHSGEVITAITRTWKDGDSGPGGRCKLCPVCVASENLCQFQINRHVAETEAPTFSTLALGARFSRSG